MRISREGEPVAWPRRWKARWIWFGDDERSPSTAVFQVEPPPRPPDLIALFRTTCVLDAVPAEAPCRVTADGRYWLSINGQPASRGPGRAEPSHLRCDELDLAPLLREGENVIAIVGRAY